MQLAVCSSRWTVTGQNQLMLIQDYIDAKLKSRHETQSF